MRQAKKVKGIYELRGKNKTVFVHSWNVDNPIEFIKTSLELTVYKVNMQKPIAFLYISNKQIVFVIRNNTIFNTIKMKNLDINLTKYV